MRCIASQNCSRVNKFIDKQRGEREGGEREGDREREDVGGEWGGGGGRQMCC